MFFELYEKTVPRWTSLQHEPLWLTWARANWINPTSRHHLALVATHLGKGCATWVARHFTHFLLATHPAIENGRQLSRPLVQRMTGGDGSSH